MTGRTGRPPWPRPQPLDQLRSIKIKLGVLVGASVLVAAALTASTAQLGWSPWLTIPAAVLLALLVTQVLARGMTAPLRQMTSIASSMAAGEHGRRAPVSSRDEVGDLGRAFNTMAAELAQVDQDRRDLIADVSHELRTPIAGLQAVLENLIDGVDQAEPETLTAALAQTQRLGRLVNDLMDLSRVESGQITLQPRPFDLDELFEEAVAEAASGHQTLRFEVDAGDSSPAVTADRSRLHQVLANLLDNAVRHSPPGGLVRLTARWERDDLIIDVVDEGLGIPAEQRVRVFERFHSLDHSRRSGATGLGLAISRSIVALHAGTITVADSDRGCDIRVTLPQRRPPAPPLR